MIVCECMSSSIVSMNFHHFYSRRCFNENAVITYIHSSCLWCYFYDVARCDNRMNKRV
jgi:hypothetical protein